MSPLDHFRREFAHCEYPHRQELEAILASGQYQRFTGPPDDRLTCRHYADIYAVRAKIHLERSRENPDNLNISHQCRAVADELSRTPQLPCRLYVCVTETQIISVFTRPADPEKAASVSWPVQAEEDLTPMQ